MCLGECVRVCVCSAVNSHACSRWIVKDMTDSICVQMCVCFGLVRLRWSVYVCVFT